MKKKKLIIKDKMTNPYPLSKKDSVDLYILKQIEKEKNNGRTKNKFNKKEK